MTRRQGPTKVLLMAAGLGTRLRPLTDKTPKCLIPVAGKPLMDYWIDEFANAGLSEVLINTHYQRDQVCAHMNAINRQVWRDGQRVSVRETYEPELLGSAGTIHANRAWADDAGDILIVYADNLSSVPLNELIAFHRSHNDPLTMMLFRTEVPERCGIAEVDADMKIVSFVEKPSNPVDNFANAGIYVVQAEAYREMADMAAFDIGTDLLPRFVGRMRGWDWPGYHRDIGTHESLALAEQDVAAGCLAPGYRRTVNWVRPTC